MSNLDEQFYELAAREVAECRPVPGTMAKAFSDADGDERKAIARYLKLRVNQLLLEHQAEMVRQDAENKRLRAAEAAAREIERNPPRKCCWHCVFFQCTGWLDRTKGICEKHQRETFSYDVCESHEWKEVGPV